jgi:hypothetical protein
VFPSGFIGAGPFSLSLGTRADVRFTGPRASEGFWGILFGLGHATAFSGRA